MNCSSAERLFDPFLAGELSGKATGKVVGHIDRCTGCRTMIEELRSVDALLNAPRRIELAPNFTFATMAEVRSVAAPRAYRTPLRAYLVSYLVAAWLIAAAGLLFVPQTMYALAGTTLDVARDIADAFGGVAAVIARLFGRGGTILSAVLGALLLLDVMVVVGLGAALRYVRPRLVDRLRS